MTRRDLHAGEYIGERYRIVGEPLHGGMGVVFIAQDLESDNGDTPQRTLYALKSLTSDTWHSPESETFKLEIAAWLSLADHPNVIKAHDIVTFREQPYLILEYAEGGNLAQRLRRALLSGAVILQIAEHICHGLIHLHRSGLIHRDLKPSNVLFDGSGIAHITDLSLSGNARVAAAGSIGQSFAGTLQYASPEHFVALNECDERSDIYSFGAVLYELICGRPVFVARSFKEYRRLHFEQAPFPPSMRKGLSESEWQTLKTVVDSCLAKRPGNRYSTFSDVLEALQLRQSPAGRSDVRTLTRSTFLDDGADEMTKAEALSRVGLHAEALQVLERSSTPSLRRLRLKGQCHFALGAVHEAVLAFTLAAEADPEDSLTKHALAACMVPEAERTTVRRALEQHASRHLPELAASNGFAYLLSFHEFESAVLGYFEVTTRLEANRSWDYCVVVFEWHPARFFRYGVLIGAPYKQSEALGKLLARVPAGDLEVLHQAPPTLTESRSLAAFDDVIRQSRSLAWTSHVSRNKVKFAVAEIETAVRFLNRRIPLALVRLGVANLDPTLIDDVVALVYTISNIESRRLVAKRDAPPGFLGHGAVDIAGKIYSERNMWETERRSRTLFLRILREHLSKIDRVRSMAVPVPVHEHVIEYARRLLAFYATKPKQH